MNLISILARALLAAAAILGLANCMSYEPPLRIALIRWPPFEFLHLAQEKGYFAEEGVEVRLIEFVAVNDTQRAFEHDKIDGGTFSLFQVLQNRDQLTRKMQVPMVIDFSDGADLLMAKPDIADVRALRGRRVGVTLSPLDIFLLFSVSDTGIGVAADRQHVLFKRFSQADSSTTRRYGGTGLGLAICKSLIELMGGEIGMRSRKGGGSMFWFRLPLRVTPSATLMLPPSFTTPARVLVVDDLEINRRVLSRQLTSWRIDHDCVNGAADALKTLHSAAAAGSPYRLALIDHMMPEVDGLTLGRQIASDRELEHTAMVMLSSAGQQNAKRFHEAGFFAVMVKPVVRARQLLNVLQAAMNAVPRTIGEGAAPAPSVAHATSAHADSCLEITKVAPRRVLLAEDNVVNAKLALRLLERLGCRVDVASNGHEALKMVQSIPFDLVFMDCQMPEMDGFEATRAIRAWERISRIEPSPSTRLPIVALTANAMQGDRERCIEAGMDDYITKPLARADLQRVLQNSGKTKAAGPHSPATLAK